MKMKLFLRSLPCKVVIFESEESEFSVDVEEKFSTALDIERKGNYLLVTPAVFRTVSETDVFSMKILIPVGTTIFFQDVYEVEVSAPKSEVCITHETDFDSKYTLISCSHAELYLKAACEVHIPDDASIGINDVSKGVKVYKGEELMISN